MKFVDTPIVAFDPASQWPDPDMAVIRPDRPPAPEMTDDEFETVFGNWAEWLKTAAEAKGAHVDYVALGLLVAASAALGNTRWVVVWDSWTEPPTLWGMLVGDPSAGKSPALDAVLNPIKDIDREFAEDYKAQRADWEAKDELAGLVHAEWKSEAKSAIAGDDTPPEKPSTADAGPPPIRKRIRVTDVTTEKVADLLSSTWRGLLLSRDELAGWLGSMDRYNGGGDRPFWLEAHGGRTYTVDRKNSREPIVVDHLTVAILGGTQPDKLDSLLVKTDDDGMLCRFLTVFPSPVPPRRPTVNLDTEVATAAFKRLHSLEPATLENRDKCPLYVHLDDDAQDALHEFRLQCREWDVEVSGLLKGHIGKVSGRFAGCSPLASASL